MGGPFSFGRTTRMRDRFNAALVPFILNGRACRGCIDSNRLENGVGVIDVREAFDFGPSLRIVVSVLHALGRNGGASLLDLGQ